MAVAVESPRATAKLIQTLDQRNIETQFAGTKCGRHAAKTTANHYDVFGH
jgi:hypothetical protein